MPNLNDQIEDNANEEMVSEHDDENCQHHFLLDLIEADEFEDADAIIVTVCRGNEVTPFAWGDNLVQLRGLAEITADYYRGQTTE